MKTCVSCKHYTENNPFMFAFKPQTCVHPDVPDIGKMVLGDTPNIGKAQIDCLVMRLNDSLCGRDGKWFEKHVPPYERAQDANLQVHGSRRD